MSEKKHYVSQLNTSVDAAQMEIGTVKSEPVQLEKSTISIMRNISEPKSIEASRCLVFV